MTSYKKRYLPTHPRSMSCGCVYEHRLVMEKHLGRYLEPHEQVHHIDEVKSNNDISNLLLCENQKAHAAEHAYDNEELIDLLVRYADIVGGLPSRKQCDAHSELPNSSTYIRHFGSWSEAKRLARASIAELNEPYEELWAM